jgi:hypothetical protein
MEVTSSSETSVLTRATRRHISEDGILYDIKDSRRRHDFNSWFRALFRRIIGQDSLCQTSQLQGCISYLNQTNAEYRVHATAILVPYVLQEKKFFTKMCTFANALWPCITSGTPNSGCFQILAYPQFMINFLHTSALHTLLFFKQHLQNNLSDVNSYRYPVIPL